MKRFFLIPLLGLLLALVGCTCTVSRRAGGNGRAGHADRADRFSIRARDRRQLMIRSLPDGSDFSLKEVFYFDGIIPCIRSDLAV